MTAGTRRVKVPRRRPLHILSSLIEVLEGGLVFDMRESIVPEAVLGANSSISIGRSGESLLDEIEGLPAIHEWESVPSPVIWLAAAFQECSCRDRLVNVCRITFCILINSSSLPN